MSKFNAWAETPEAVEVTRSWVKRESPVVFLYGPSGVGKTHLVGSIFRHPLYHRVLYIDIDQGGTTIAEYTLNEQICDRQEFDQVPSMRVGWFNKQLAYARTAKCGAIVIEGFTSILTGMVSAKLEQIDDPDGPEAMRAHIGPSNRTGALIESFRSLKQYRLANKAGVPIIVTLNTRYSPVDPTDMKNPARKIVPDWSQNLNDKAMRVASGFVEIDRTPTGVTLHTQATPDNKARKLRSCVPFTKNDPNAPNAAALIQREVNLTLPGMFALWASADQKMRDSMTALLNQGKTTT